MFLLINFMMPCLLEISAKKKFLMSVLCYSLLYTIMHSKYGQKYNALKKYIYYITGIDLILTIIVNKFYYGKNLINEIMKSENNDNDTDNDNDSDSENDEDTNSDSKNYYQSGEKYDDLENKNRQEQLKKMYESRKQQEKLCESDKCNIFDENIFVKNAPTQLNDVKQSIQLQPQQNLMPPPQLQPQKNDSQENKIFDDSSTLQIYDPDDIPIYNSN